MTLPIVYRKGGPTIASYNAFDIAQGTGIVEFYGGQASGALVSTTNPYVLNNNVFYSQRIATQGSTSSAADVALIKDLDFDVTFNRPLILNGISVVNVPVRIQKTGGSQGVGRIDVFLYKVVGSTETKLAQASGALWTVAAGSDQRAVDALYMTVPVTTIEAGDKLRLNVQSWGRIDGGGSAVNVDIGHDPANRATDEFGTAGTTWGSTPTQLSIKLPVQIDI